MAKVLPTKKTERAGVNEFRALMESAGHIVQEIDGGNDYGEDCYLSFTEHGERTGDIVAVQVKSGGKYRRAVGYGIPCRDHVGDWTRSRIPVIGIVYDPELKKLFWVNMTQYLLEQLKQGKRPKSVPVSESAILDADTLVSIVANVRHFIARNDGLRHVESRGARHPIRTFRRYLNRESNEIDRTPVGRIPYEMATSEVDFHERHPGFNPAFLKWSAWLLTTVVLAVQGPALYVAADSQHRDWWIWNGWTWLVCYYGTVLYLLRVSKQDPQKRRGRLLSFVSCCLIACGMFVTVGHQGSGFVVNREFERWFIDLMPVFAKIAIMHVSHYYVDRERERRRRLKAAYPDGIPSR
ncbi:DUF4365 domain-containing protein [Streptomyces luteoverticillatus]|uniref:DUF4365 domain-containing protein n=1 Tax=Streptomyces luteoverticillatus TaxID=66425 RepID=UPI0013DF8D5B|nr:DUF4365 domain-containing protein [Streptomyces luteoverticillatus]